MEYCGGQGFGMMCTVQRNRLPKGVPTKYFAKLPTTPGDKKARVARFNHPITAVKEFIVNEKSFRLYTHPFKVLQVAISKV